MLALVRSFARSRSGVAATEFALICPLLLALLLGTLELSNFALEQRRAENASTLLTEYLSRDPDNTLTDRERIQAQEILPLINPTAISQAGDVDGVRVTTHAFSYASITFDPTDPDCVSIGCEFTPRVHWNFYAGTKGGVQGRRIACKLRMVSNKAKLDAKNIPEGMAGRSAVVMTHVVYRYESLLAGAIMPSFDKDITKIRKTRSGVRLDIDSESLRSKKRVRDCS